MHRLPSDAYTQYLTILSAAWCTPTTIENRRERAECRSCCRGASEETSDIKHLDTLDTRRFAYASGWRASPCVTSFITAAPLLPTPVKRASSHARRAVSTATFWQACARQESYVGSTGRGSMLPRLLGSPLIGSWRQPPAAPTRAYSQSHAHATTLVRASALLVNNRTRSCLPRAHLQCLAHTCNAFECTNNANQ
eukprot:7375899-Pyramimonas_sp.AAC.1